MFWLLVNYNNSNKESRSGRKFCNKTKLVSTKGLSLIKSWGFPLPVMNKAHAYFRRTQKENNYYIEPKELPNSSNPCLLSAYTWQPETLVTTLI